MLFLLVKNPPETLDQQNNRRKITDPPSYHIITFFSLPAQPLHPSTGRFWDPPSIIYESGRHVTSNQRDNILSLSAEVGWFDACFNLRVLCRLKILLLPHWESLTDWDIYSDVLD